MFAYGALVIEDVTAGKRMLDEPFQDLPRRRRQPPRRGQEAGADVRRIRRQREDPTIAGQRHGVEIIHVCWSNVQG